MEDEKIFVSIPFIAGQWSLRRGGSRRHRPLIMFQSPSLRGSGRFGQGIVRLANGLPCFNPLHCGAVVASPFRSEILGIPNLVSIPFIAGQWSLL